MAGLRFRAAAVLELRRKQEQAATVVVSAAEDALLRAKTTLNDREVERRTAQDQQVASGRRGSDISAIEWHRNWIVRLAATAAELRGDVDAKGRDVARAEAARCDARRRRLSLERMRDRAVRRFADEQDRQERQLLDELGRLRYVMPDAWKDES